MKTTELKLKDRVINISYKDHTTPLLDYVLFYLQEETTQQKIVKDIEAHRQEFPDYMTLKESFKLSTSKSLGAGCYDSVLLNVVIESDYQTKVTFDVFEHTLYKPILTKNTYSQELNDIILNTNKAVLDFDTAQALEEERKKVLEEERKSKTEEVKEENKQPTVEAQYLLNEGFTEIDWDADRYIEDESYCDDGFECPFSVCSELWIDTQELNKKIQVVEVGGKFFTKQ